MKKSAADAIKETKMRLDETWGELGAGVGVGVGIAASSLIAPVSLPAALLAAIVSFGIGAGVGATYNEKNKSEMEAAVASVVDPFCAAIDECIKRYGINKNLMFRPIVKTNYYSVSEWLQSERFVLEFAITVDDFRQGWFRNVVKGIRFDVKCIERIKVNDSDEYRFERKVRLAHDTTDVDSAIADVRAAFKIAGDDLRQHINMLNKPGASLGPRYPSL